MKNFVKIFFRNFFIGYGVVVILILISSFMLKEISILITKEFLSYMAIVIFFVSMGSTFSFQPKFRHINIWLRRVVLSVYISILSDIGVYIFLKYVLNITKNLTSVMLLLPVRIFLITFPLYFIADKIEAAHIKKMNESLKQYNQNSGDGL